MLFRSINFLKKNRFFRIFFAILAGTGISGASSSSSSSSWHPPTGSASSSGNITRLAEPDSRHAETLPFFETEEDKDENLAEELYRKNPLPLAKDFPIDNFFACNTSIRKTNGNIPDRIFLFKNSLFFDYEIDRVKYKIRIPLIPGEEMSSKIPGEDCYVVLKLMYLNEPRSTIYDPNRRPIKNVNINPVANLEIREYKEAILEPMERKSIEIDDLCLKKGIQRLDQPIKAPFAENVEVDEKDIAKKIDEQGTAKEIKILLHTNGDVLNAERIVLKVDSIWFDRNSISFDIPLSIPVSAVHSHSVGDIPLSIPVSAVHSHSVGDIPLSSAPTSDLDSDFLVNHVIKQTEKNRKYRFEIPLIPGQPMRKKDNSVKLQLMYPDNSNVFNPDISFFDDPLKLVVEISNANSTYENLKTQRVDLLNNFQLFLKKQGFRQILDEAIKCLLEGKIDDIAITRLYDALFLVNSLFPPYPFFDSNISYYNPNELSDSIIPFLDFDSELTTNEEPASSNTDETFRYSDQSIQKQLFFQDLFSPTEESSADLVAFLVTHGCLESIRSRGINYQLIWIINSQFNSSKAKLTKDIISHLLIEDIESCFKSIVTEFKKNGTYFSQFFYIYHGMKKWKDQQCKGIIPNFVKNYRYDPYILRIIQDIYRYSIPSKDFDYIHKNFRDLDICSLGAKKVYSRLVLELDKSYFNQQMTDNSNKEVSREQRTDLGFIVNFLKTRDLHDILEKLKEADFEMITNKKRKIFSIALNEDSI